MMEKTVLINCSPKRSLSVSGFLMRCAGLLIRGKKEYFHLRTPADYQPILQALKTAGKVVFVTPLYVDSVPSHMLPFMREMEAFCRENGLRLKVYVIANNGFIEGRQNEPLMQVMENFCICSGLDPSKYAISFTGIRSPKSVLKQSIPCSTSGRSFSLNHA